MSSPHQPFAQLTWLVLWHKEAVTDNPEAAKKETRPGSKDERQERPKDGLLYCYSRDGPDQQQQKRFGLAQGLIDFVRLLSTDETMVRSVQSSQKRLIFLQPEPEFYLVANILLPHRVKANASKQSHQPTDETIDDDVLRQTLQRGFDHFQLLHGSLTWSALERGLWSTAQGNLASFYDSWIPRWEAETQTLGGADLSQYLGVTAGPLRAVHLPELDNFVRRRGHASSCSACFFEGKQYIAQATTGPSSSSSASTSACSPRTWSALIAYLTSHLPDAPPPPSSVSSQEAPQRTAQRQQGSSLDPIWHSTVGMGQQIGQYFTLPSSLAPGAKSSSSSIKQPKTSAEAKGKQRAVSAPWPKVSWDSITKPFSSSSSSSAADESSSSRAARRSLSPSPSSSTTAAADRRPSRHRDEAQDSDTDSDESVADHISKLAEKRVPFEGETEATSESGADPTQEGSGSSTSKVPDSDAISEALSSEIAIAGLESSEAAAVKVCPRLSIFDAHTEQPAWLSATRFQSRHLTLLVVTPDISQDSDSLVQDARSTLTRLEVPKPLRPLSNYRYLVKNASERVSHGLGWPTREERWSGSLASSKEADLLGCLLQGQKAMDGPFSVSQSMIRTGTNQWAVTKRNEDGHQDLYMVLPRRFGKEGSLVDATAEMEKLEHSMR